MFEYLHKYICDSKEEQKESYSFYQLSQEEIDEAEQRLGFVFPDQLKLFYEEVGYGFFYDKDGCFTDVLMKPSDVVDYRLGEVDYEYIEERAFLSNAIMEHLGLRSKETLRKNYLNPAIEIGLIRMTLPDKPNSKNQRYVKQ